MNKITNESLFALKNVGQPQVSAQHFFFTQTTMNQKDNRYDTNILGINRESKEISEWGDNSSYNSQLSLSPAKDFLSFLTQDSGTKQLQLSVQSLTGGKARILTQEEKGIRHYFWSADGQAIYYQTVRSQEDEVATASPKEKEDIALPKPTVIQSIFYKLDGAGVLPKGQLQQLKKYNLQTKETILLAESSEDVTWQFVDQAETYAIFTQQTQDMRSFVYRYDFEKQEVELLQQQSETGSYSFIAANPSQTDLLLLGNEFEYGFVTQNNLYCYHLADDTLVNLTAEMDVEWGDLLVADFQQEVYGVELQWIDDRTFLFSSTEAGAIHLYRVTLDGDFHKIVNELMHVTGAALINSEELLLTYATLTNPSALAIYNITTQQLENIYQPNDEFLEEHQLTTPERFSFNGYDDWTIHGWYLPPVVRQLADTSASDKHPAILYVHGGPQVAYGESFFHEMQVLSALGYGVIMINPRGGNSYGQQFVASILGNYGNHDYDDLMLGVDAVLKAHPEIDDTQLFVAGGSYGGFMTNWIVTHTNRFKAAVTQRSISNWISFYGTSDIGPWFVEYQLQADIFDAQRLWEMSPIAHINQATTPLLVLHGQQDLRCPQEQGEQMYMALKRKGIDTKMITFPESSHGLSRNGLPNLRQERLKAVQEWFAKYTTLPINKEMSQQS